MSADIPTNNHQAVPEEQTTVPSLPAVPNPSLSPLAIERICRAFIRLITAEEDATHATQQQPETVSAPRKRDSSRVRATKHTAAARTEQY